VTGYGSITFAYTNQGRMSSATVSGNTFNYVYNPLGQLVKRSGPGITLTYFVYDEAGHLVGEYGNTGQLIQETVWLGDTPVATLRSNGSGGVDIYYVHTDHLNTPRKVTRPSDDKLRWRWDPDAFGNGSPSQNPQSLGNFVYNLRFPGQTYSAETGLNYNYFRDYDPAIGRYVESDPVGLRGGINTFGYAYQNPVAYSDMFGLEVNQDKNNYCWEGVGIKCANKKLPPVDKQKPNRPDPRKKEGYSCSEISVGLAPCIACCATRGPGGYGEEPGSICGEKCMQKAGITSCENPSPGNDSPIRRFGGANEIY
jgi:RHS repeat-associated protein